MNQLAPSAAGLGTALFATGAVRDAGKGVWKAKHQCGAIVGSNSPYPLKNLAEFTLLNLLFPYLRDLLYSLKQGVSRT